jgi:hypothetical protein
MAGMIKTWFYEQRFKDFCIEKGLEPQLNDIGNRLVLICPKIPQGPLQKEIVRGIEILVPKEVHVEIQPGLSMNTRRIIMTFLHSHGIQPFIKVQGTYKEGEVTIPNIAIMINPDKEGEVALIVLMVNQTPSNQPDAPIWREAGQLLQKDPFVKHWSIIVGPDLVRNSEGFVKGDVRTFNSYPEEMEESQPDWEEKKSISGTSKVPATTKDDRFDYDREFLPEDVGMDVKILLESCQTVEEFLKNI